MQKKIVDLKRSHIDVYMYLFLKILDPDVILGLNTWSGPYPDPDLKSRLTESDIPY